MTTDWDASTYHRVSAPHQTWGPEVMDRLALRGDERVLDAGCGSGRVTRLLAERLPEGRVIAVDVSAAMVAEARLNLADLGDRVEVHRMDLLELSLAEPVDAIFSSAVFHWVPDHDGLFARLYGALCPGGRLSLQCGGAGNIAGVLAATHAVSARAPFARHLDGLRDTWRFAGAEETRARLEQSGFREVRAWLAESEQLLSAGEEAESYLTAIPLRDHLGALPEALRPTFTRAVARRLGGADGRVTLDYVRLNADALR